MQWRVRGGSSATRAMRKEQRDRWSPKPLVKGKPAAPRKPRIRAGRGGRRGKPATGSAHQAQERAGHRELDVVRMRRDGDGGPLSHAVRLA